MSEIEFVKMHASGNDYVLINELPRIVIPENKKSATVTRLCERRYSVGADGVIFTQKSESADVRFRIFNSDGSEAEMCGNGLRCLSKYMFSNKLAKGKTIRIETLTGIITSRILPSGEIEIDMGEPILVPEKIPVKTDRKDFVDQELNLKGLGVFRVTVIGMGNPHAIVPADVDSVDVLKIGRAIRRHPIFPKGANVTFFERAGRNELRTRTYERGVENETLSCGTGVTATATAACLLSMCDSSRPIKVITRGGNLLVRIIFKGKKPIKTYLIGNAVSVYRGFVKC